MFGYVVALKEMRWTRRGRMHPEGPDDPDWERRCPLPVGAWLEQGQGRFSQ